MPRKAYVTVMRSALIAAPVLFGAALGQDLPSPLDAALSQAEAAGPAAYAFTMTFAWTDAAPVRLRFTPGEGWRTLSGDPDALPDDAQDALATVKEDEAAPGGLLYGDFRPALRRVRLHEETDDLITYDFEPPEAERADQEARAAMTARLVIDKKTGGLASYEVEATERFRPLPMVRVDAFGYEQAFETVDDGPPVLVRIRSLRRGRRMFKDVNVDFVATFTDHRRID